ncbi:uncharacterized protein UBRO2_02080 [Ustilago bromivora]|uniref:CENP-V/GFA domain-containing protein n=1 Tax=Ustilago bromivora TaxID=307758 RepID=A0A8H8QLB4_9BASI|nr:uncharacterized protein UBRO2_02080 [Ustilago bromivora]
MPPLNGSCLCGNIKITVKDGGLPLKPVVCRCTNCQQTAGARECGSPIQTVPTSRPGTAIIKMGLFAKSGAWGKEIDAPVAQVFTKNKVWESLVEGAATMQDQTA